MDNRVETPEPINEPISSQEGLTEGATSEITDLKRQVTALQSEKEALKDQLLRAMAEAQNVQRRIRAQAEEDKKFAVLPLVEMLLPVLDNLERTMRAAEQGASLEKLLEGVGAVDRQLRRALESASVNQIDAHGRQFDPEHHEALAELPSEEHNEGTVAEVLETGYTLHGRVVRPARVKVTTKP
ncbi:MAG: nucleotide exchange factor GrpE [Fimbriimonadaceae bacterium]|nr:nucleotide exchange factor GrpE [Fimbriimonadaceae bacterium]QYK55621.1 MAG: nucleotide exchange factor GrpE [Fimbriimonadaceae bacterium]